ncbi:hypothetical protein BDK51DRAFT_45906 [Blyttiomyces helicus]|uniref:Uncharacterized protein n=1 Tax=Blyttiomyces helicus TaxID=388810 RepID=A0A4P9VZ78_9FUNG|nr:hypothetical protein BDK51DRAFT_45906 [Blyttiomyces helicus]|eukprot:RKO83116.1 hypothetical protein BDK51DRAFT_45906 [Blyttiomyces helicus]
MFCRLAIQTVYQKFPWASAWLPGDIDKAMENTFRSSSKERQQIKQASSQALSTFVHIPTPGEMAPMAADIYLTRMVGSW